MLGDYKNCVFCLENPTCNHVCCHFGYPDYKPDLEKIKRRKGEISMGLTIENLNATFAAAKQEGANYVAVLIEMEGFEKPEVIINSYENFDTKRAYYEKTYDENLNHKFAKGIKIVGLSYGDSFEDIESDLLG